MSDAASSADRGRPRRRWLRRIAWGVPLLLVALLGARAAFFTGPFAPPGALPDGRIVDLHCHTAGIGAGDSGCFVSPELQSSYKFRIYLDAFGTSQAELTAQGDGVILRRISEGLSASHSVKAAVVLALDGAVDRATGELDRARTQVFVPNEFLAKETARYTNLYWGASVNPHRRDALARLDWAAAHGAVVVKWIPSIMDIDPAEPGLTNFYRRLVELRLPLLCHAGQERSFVGARDELCDPERLQLPLSLGVTVIAAHIASTGANGGERDTDRLARMMGRYPNLYSEVSSLTQLNKPGYLGEAVLRPEFRGRLCYGSDFPLVNTALVSPWFFNLRLPRAEMARIAAVESPWDRDVELKRALGVPADVFVSAAQWIPRLAGGAASHRAP